MKNNTCKVCGKEIIIKIGYKNYCNYRCYHKDWRDNLNPAAWQRHLARRKNGIITLHELNKYIRNIVPMMELIGCTLPELKSHIEKKFKPGMNWENHTSLGWHIDHIKPIASFDFSNPEEKKKCFHYTNLQPLWHGENYSKGCSQLKIPVRQVKSNPHN